MLVWRTQLAPFGSYYRRLLAQRLIGERVANVLSTDRIPSPFLATFVRIAHCDDMMDVLRLVWNDKQKTIGRTAKVNHCYSHIFLCVSLQASIEHMCLEFRKAFIETAFALNQIQMPNYSINDTSIIQVYSY